MPLSVPLQCLTILQNDDMERKLNQECRAKLLSYASRVYLILCFLFAGCVNADAKQSAYTSILSNYRAMNADMEKQDVEGYLTFLAPDYVRIDRNGFHSDLQRQRKSLITTFALANNFALGKSLHSNLAIRPLKVSKQSVTAARVEQLKMTLVNHTTGRNVPFVSNSVYEDIWVKAGMTWKIRQSKLMNNLTLINGKPFTGKFHS